MEKSRLNLAYPDVLFRAAGDRFWIIKSDFDLMWWVSNLYLLLYPLFFIPKLLETKEAFAES